MKTLKLKDGISWIGALDPDLRIFDIVMYAEFGTTYNSYVVKGSEKTAIVENVKVKFFDEYIDKLKNEVDPEKIDYIIINHTEPDHAGSLEKFLDIAKNAKVVGSSTAIKFLRAITNREFEFIIANTGTEISLGDKTLHFISAPFLHWPDSMYTYVKEAKTLFTCDSFGSHYSFDPILSSKITNHDDYYKALRYYYDMIMGPFKPYVLEAISKIENLDIDLICPGHGPVLDDNPWHIVEKYREWSTEINPNTKRTVVIPFVSAYGYTKELAHEIKRGIQSKGDINVELYDMVEEDKGNVLSRIRWADGVIFGSPTINSDALPPIWDLLMNLSPIVHGGKLASAFGSFGWSGEAVYNIERRLQELRMKVISGLRINFKPKQEELLEAYELGTRFGDYVLGGVKDIPVKKQKDKKGNPQSDGTKKLWRCVICGEVYEGVEPPEVCPACGASSEQFEVYIEKKVEFKSETKEDIVIIGNNAAGTAAVEAIRARNTVSSVRIVDRDPHRAYYRPMLSDYISDSHEEKNFYLHDEQWYKDNNITLSLGVSVKGVDAQNNQVILDNGETVKYDKLILANGSYNFIPQIIDIHKAGVFTIKSMNDADRVKEKAKNASAVVVIGGGLLGLEAAWELKKLGLKVSVVEMEQRLLPKQLDAQGSALFETGIAKAGVEIVKGATVNAILGDESAKGVQLTNGNKIDADMVIVSVGIRPETGLAEQAGIEINRGVVVDEFMRTNIPNIYAAGDVAEFKGINYGIWPEATEQGKVAGANAAGDNVKYEGITPSNVFNGMNMNVFSIGDFGLKEGVDYKFVTDYDPEKAIYKKLCFLKGKFTGGILIGDVSKTLNMIRGVEGGASVQQMIDEIIIG